MIRAQSLRGAEVLAAVTLPWVQPDVGYAIGQHFAQIWSNPPASTPGSDPGIVTNSFGKGKAVWLAAPVESGREEVYAHLVGYLLKRLLPGTYHFEADINPVEMTLFQQPEKHRLLVRLLNMQEQVPTISVGGTVRVRVPADHRARRVLHLPDQKEIPFEKIGAYVQLNITPFKMLTMALVEYE